MEAVSIGDFLITGTSSLEDDEEEEEEDESPRVEDDTVPLAPSEDVTTDASLSIITIVVILVVVCIIIGCSIAIGLLCLSRKDSGRAERGGEYEIHPAPLDESIRSEQSMRRESKNAEKIINRMKVMPYMHSLNPFGEKDCCFCLEEFQDGISIRIVPECRHIFHAECLEEAIRFKRRDIQCPMCRVPLKPNGKKLTDEAAFMPTVQASSECQRNR